MNRRIAASAASVGAIALLALTTSFVAGPALADVSPSPSPVSVTVVIPGATSTPTPTPSPSSSHHGGGSGGGTGSGGSSLPTEADGSPKVPDSPTSGAGGLWLDHGTISAHGLMTAKGTGFAPGEKVKLVLYSSYVVVGNYTADASGAFIAQFRISESVRPGLHTAEATGWDSRHVLNKQFTVVSAVVPAGGIPFVWWLIVVSGVLLLSILVALFYFRRSIGFGLVGVGIPAGSAP